MTKEELRSLTIEQLNGMTEEQLDVVANQVIAALVMSLMQLIMGK